MGNILSPSISIERIYPIGINPSPKLIQNGAKTIKPSIKFNQPAHWSYVPKTGGKIGSHTLHKGVPGPIGNLFRVSAYRIGPRARPGWSTIVCLQIRILHLRHRSAEGWWIAENWRPNKHYIIIMSSVWMLPCNSFLGSCKCLVNLP